MYKRKAVLWIVLPIIALVLAGGYTINRTFSPPIGEKDNWHPTGRVVTVQRGSVPIGINGLGTVKNSSSIEIVTGIKEEEAKNVKIGEKAKIWVHEKSSAVEGEIIKISDKPRIVNNKVFLDVTIYVKEDMKVRDGASAEVQIVLDNKQNAIVIPSLALQKRDDGGSYVWVLPPNWEDKPGNKIKPIIRNVKTGYVDERNAEVTEGLQEGEKVVIPSSQD